MADKNKEQYYSPPQKLGFGKFLWNSETSQCLGRTGGSWAKILFFYLIFYAALAGFFAAMLAVFYQTLRVDRPKWLQDDGLIGSNPGLGFRPMPPDANVESTLVWYDASKPDNYKYWTEEIVNFLKAYDDLPSQNRVNCSFEQPPPPGKVCHMPAEVFQSCTAEKNFGYTAGKPCIFLKLNKIYDWKPEIYNNATHLPAAMSQGLKDHIGKMQLMRPLENDLVWVSCEGENPADLENIKATDYYPRMGFPGYYFPYTNIEGYIPPLVAVQFHVQTGVLINIECKAWAKNIKHDRADRKGSVHFELMVD